VDRLAVKPDARRRLTDSVETALWAGRRGVGAAGLGDLAEDDPHRERIFSEHLACLYDNLSFDELSRGRSRSTRRGGRARTAPGWVPGWRSTRSWSSPTRTRPWPTAANRPLGRRSVPRLLLPAHRGPGRHARVQHGHPVVPAARRGPGCLAARLRRPVHVHFTTARGRERSYDRGRSRGAIPFLERSHSEAESDSSREQFEGFMREGRLPLLPGDPGSSPSPAPVTVDGRPVAELCALPISETGHPASPP